nr:putative ribonuclease H-like domain-containing protein [Tanacetum cinerariifolium]
TMNYHPVIEENQSNTHAGFQDIEKVGEEGTQSYVLFLVLSDGSTNSQNNNNDAHADRKEHDDDIQKSVFPKIHSSSSGAQTRKQGDKTENKDKDNTNDFSAAGPSNAATPNLEDLSHDTDDVSVEADINNLESIILVSPIPTTRIHKDHPTSQIIGKSASTLIDVEKPLLKDSDGEDVDVHTYRSMIASLMYLTSSRPDIMFAVCACA